MSEDLISDNFVDNVDKILIRRVLLAIKISLVLFILYAILQLLQWYIFFQKSTLVAGKSIAIIYYNAPALVSALILI